MIKLLPLLLLLFPVFTACDTPLPLTEYFDISREKALKIIPKLPKDIEHIYIKRIISVDSSMLYMKYNTISKDSLLHFKEMLSKKVQLTQSTTLPASWPGYNAIPISSRPAWWKKCTGTQYYYDVMIGSDKHHRDRSEGISCCIDVAVNEVSIWHWSIKGWGAHRGK